MKINWAKIRIELIISIKGYVTEKHIELTAKQINDVADSIIEDKKKNLLNYPTMPLHHTTRFDISYAINNYIHKSNPS